MAVTDGFGDDSRRATRATDDRSVGDLIGEVADDFQRLVRQQLELAKVELKEQAVAAGRAGALFGIAALAGLMTVLMVSFALVFALAEVMPAGWAAFIVAVVWVAIGAVTYVMARLRLRAVSPVPQKTVETLKEDMQWLRNPTG
jgi:uncharacterized membrane protein YqjE